MKLILQKDMIFQKFGLPLSKGGGLTSINSIKKPRAELDHESDLHDTDLDADGLHDLGFGW